MFKDRVIKSKVKKVNETNHEYIFLTQGMTKRVSFIWQLKTNYRHMKRMLIICIGVLIFNVLSVAQQFSDLSEEIPFDSAFRTGVLPNGLTYYIRHNDTPKERASFYIYQNVGAVLEKDNQDGLAHFLEHMAFNGTNTFPGNSMLDMLERNGLKFGKDINAYTAKNETVYNISRVPTKREGLVDTCLLILRDWCDELALDEDEINAERGVISEEWRTRRNAGFRLRGKIGQVKYNGSIYAERDVIGELDVIKNFDPAALRQFYHDWYRTDLQAVGIVGDFDVDKIEKQVIELFSAIPAINNPKPRTTILIPDNEKPLYVAATDREVKNVSVKLSVRHRFEPENSLATLRENLVTRFFNALIKNRISEVRRKDNPPFLGASINYMNFERGYRTFNVQASAKVGEEGNAFEAIYTELQRVVNFGFTAGELERLKTNMLVTIENQHDNERKKSSDSYCKSIKGAYLSSSSIPSSEFSYSFTKEIIPTISLEEVSLEASRYLSDINRVYTVIGPEQEGVEFISQKEIEKIIAKVQAKNLTPYVDEAPVSSSLLSELPEGGRIVSEKQLELFDAVEWTLSNGARVVYRFADFQKGIVSLDALSYGGSSLYQPEDLPSMGALKSFSKSFGIGDFTASEYKKVMTGNTAHSKFNIGGYTESVSAVCNTNDVESMMQLVYMRYDQPRFDKEEYDRNLKRSYEALDRQVVTTQSIIKDTLRTILSNGNPRSLDFNKDYLDKMNYERMQTIYKERFSNAADFIFFIVGDVDAETLKPLVEQYIGAISGDTDIKENWEGHADYFPKGKSVHRIEVPMEDPKASVMLKFRNGCKYSREAVIYQSIIGSVLRLRFTENIREKEGGTYGVGVRTSANRIPEMRLGMDINFDCDPDKADYLKQLVYQELNEIQNNVLQSDLKKVVLNMKKNNEHSREKNSYWMNALQMYYDTGENILDSSYYNDIIDNVSIKDIAKAAKKFFNKANNLEIVILPDEKY